MNDPVKPTIGLRGVPTWMVAAGCLALLAIGVFIYWTDSKDRDEDQALASQAFEGMTLASENALKLCLAGEDGKPGLLPNADGAWKDTARGDRGYNPALSLFVDLIPAIEGFSVRVLTREGKALSADQRAIVTRCIVDAE